MFSTRFRFVSIVTLVLSVVVFSAVRFGTRTEAQKRQRDLAAAATTTSVANEISTKGEAMSVRLKGPNAPAFNFNPGRDLPTIYDSVDYSSEQMKGGQNRPTALASADFDVDGFPDLVTGYSAPSGGGVLTFHKGNAEAFAPQSEESIALIKDGHFPDPFLQKAESFAIPSAPDFLVAGDFDRDGNLDVITATRGGQRIFLFSGKGTESGFNPSRSIELPGRVTALTAGEIDLADNRADLMIGVEDDAGAALLVYEDAERGIAAAPLKYRLQALAISLELGKLDDDAWMDAAILTDVGVSVLHGSNRRTVGKSAGNNPARMEQINLPFVPQALTLGQFVWDRAGKTELALLAPDGTVQIAHHGTLDERPFSLEESRLNRRQHFDDQMRGSVVERLKDWQIGTSENWTISDSVKITASANRQNKGAPILMKSNISGQNTEDILFLDSLTREVKIVYTQEPEKTGNEAVSFAGERSVYTLEAANEPTAMLSMPLNIFVRPGLVILQEGKSTPSFVPSAPTATFDVDRTDDTNAVAAQGCTAAANDCSLRGAITKANGANGADVINVPAGTYTLTLANSGGTNEDNNATGDLDILGSITITGAGQATTIIQAGTTNANGIDKVFASNPICTSVVNTSISDLTVRYGRNTQANGSPDFSYTGGGLDWCNPGAGGTLMVTNSTFDNNSATTSAGGGIDLDTSSTTSDTVTLTGVTISNNKSSNPAAGGITIPADGGGLSIIGGFTYNVNITNSTITGNAAQSRSGGGINFSQSSTSGSALQISGTTISNNSAFNIGGGINFNGSLGGTTSFTLNQSSVVSGNTSGTGASGVAQGGGVYVASFAGSATINKTTITSNVLSATATTNRGGAGIAAGQGPITISYNRIVGNTGTATLGTGLNKDINSGSTDASENWWGCSTGPNAAPCDTAVLTPGSTGSLISTPYIVLRHTANPTTIVTGQSSTLTASFLTDSANNTLLLSNIPVLLGLPITFSNPVRGTISNAQANIQSNGTATATFTGTSIGAGSADAIVDNDVAAAGRTNRAAITINQASTTTTITSDNPDPSVRGQSITPTFTVVGQFGGTPTGNVTVSDGVNSCVGTVAAGSCNVALTTVGNRTLTATYAGDTNFTTSTSPGVPHTVNKADTTATITADTPDPSFRLEAVTVSYSVTVNPSGSGTPSGNVSVTDGVNSCTGTVAAGQCSLSLTTSGNRVLTATYQGDTSFNASPASAGAPHTVRVVTASGVSVSGRVLTTGGRGVRGSQVDMTDQQGVIHTVVTDSFGSYRFDDVEAGKTYIISVISRRFQFDPRIIVVTDNLTGVDLIASW